MAFNNGFPVTYQPAYYSPTNPYYQQMQNPTIAQQAQQMQQAQQVQSQQVQQPTIQQSGFVPVPSEQVARNYPVAPGNSITFKDENAPYCYVKTMGFNQLDRPTFEKYRLVKEEDSQNIAQNTPRNEDNTKDGNDTKYALKSDLDAIWGEINALKEKSKTEKKKNKLVMEDDDDE